MVSIAKLTSSEVVAIDGKALCGTREAGKKTLVHMVSAWASANNLVLAQRKVDDKSNEITAIPKLLDALELSRSVVAIDARVASGQWPRRSSTKRPTIFWPSMRTQAISWSKSRTRSKCWPPPRWPNKIDCGHGRVEQRKCSVIADHSLVEKARSGRLYRGWCGLNRSDITRLRAKTEREILYDITSLEPDAVRLNQAIREHWGIENKLHWALDASFVEDVDRKRAGHAAQNFSLLNRIALNLLKKETTYKLGIKRKRLKAGWDNDYLQLLLGN